MNVLLLICRGGPGRLHFKGGGTGGMVKICALSNTG